MNMLTSLKAMLFSSTAVGSSASAPTPAAGAADFAALLNGSMAEATPVIGPVAAQSAEAVTTALGIPVAAPANAPIAAEAQVGMAVGQSPDAVAARGLAIAVAAGKASGVPLSLPQGLALGPVKRGAEVAPVEPPILSDPPAAAPAEAAPVEQAATPAVGGVPEEELQAPAGSEMAELSKGPKLSRAPRQSEIPIAVAVPPEEQDANAFDPACDEQDEPESHVKDQPPPAALPLVGLPIMPSPAAPAPAPVRGDSSPSIRLEVEARDQAPSAAAALSNPAETTPSDSAPAGAPAQAVSPLVSGIAAQPARDRTSDAARASPVETSTLVPAAEESIAAAPVLDGKPMKSEILSLLQLARDQASTRQPGAVARTVEQSLAPAGKRPEARSAVAEASTAALTVAPAADLTQPAFVPSAAAPAPSAIMSATPTVDLSASLNTQVVDMGVSGQWIDGLARDIAGLSAHGAQGRFQINADQLGPVQVDIRQGAEGAAVHLTVANEAAEMALRQDSDRLRLDAGLSAVRIAEVKIDRASHVNEPARADTTGQQSSQQQSQQSPGQGAAAWANNSQNMGQPQSQQGRWRAGENNGPASKSSSDPAVLNHAHERQDASDSRRARYA